MTGGGASSEPDIVRPEEEKIILWLVLNEVMGYVCS